MTAEKKYIIFETLYSFALSFTKATFVIFFFSHSLSNFEVGLIFGIFNLTVIVAEPITAIYAELFGRKKSLLFGCFLKVIAASLFIYGNQLSHFLIAEVFSGVALTFISGCLMAWLVQKHKEGNSSKKLYEIFSQTKKYKYMALIVGALLGAFAGDYSLDIPWIANGCVFLILLLILFFFMDDSVKEEQFEFKKSLRKVINGYNVVLKDSCISLLILTSFLSAFSLSTIKLFWLPTIKINFSTSVSALGWLWVGIAASLLLGTYCVRPYLKRFKTKLDGLMLLTFFSTACFLCVIFFINSIWTIVFYFLLELGKPLYSVVKDDLINYQISEAGRVTVLSIHSLSIKLGVASGLIFIGYLSDIWGMQHAWFFSAVIFLGNLFLYYYVRKKMKNNPTKQEFLSVVNQV